MSNNNSGNVGIGTTAPGGKLHIQQDGSGITDGIKFTALVNSAEDWYQYMDATDNLVFRDDATNVITFENGTGNVGIGTTTPSAQLHTTGSVRLEGLGSSTQSNILVRDASGNLSYRAAGSWAGGDGNGIYDGSGSLSGNTVVTQVTNQLSFNLNSTGDFNVQDNGVTTFQVRDNGITYIGDDTYWNDASVTGTTIARLYDSGDDGVFQVYKDGSLQHSINSVGTTVFNEQADNNDFRIESVNRTNVFWVDANEDLVRFGTNSTTSDGSNGSTIDGTVVDYVADFDRGTAEGTAIGIGSIEFLLDGNSRTAINNAFVPTTHINKDLGYSTITQAWDDVYADNYVNVSDRREKENIQELEYGLEEILAMRPVSYVLKKDPFGETKLGLIAQEALELVTEAVKTIDYKELDESRPGEYTKVELERMGMTYNSLIPVLIKATQEQQAIIEKLQHRIEELEKNK
jgi:hypothetical protein